MIIDLHTHFKHASKVDESRKNIYKADLDFLKEEHKSMGIQYGCFSSFESMEEPSVIYEENKLLFDIADKNKWVYQWVVLDPRQENLFDQIRGMIHSKKVLGIKIHSVYHKYDILEYGDKIFEFANELKCPVLMHPDKITDMVKFADKYPDMKLIIAHLGGEEHIEAIKHAKHGNIFTDTSGIASSNNNIIEYAVKTVGSEKIFFGTDSYSCAFQLGRIKYARISWTDKQNILYKNALKHFDF